MCGIAGFWNRGGGPVDRSELEAFTRTLAHRGPDGEGYRIEDEGRLGLGHRRLAILGVGESGTQPMAYADDRWWIVFNGEIFNFVELGRELEAAGYAFRTRTDTEVVLAAWDRWGRDCLPKFNGMWAFALWDRREQVLTLCRDRFGIKPAYYVARPDLFAFASEVKAFRKLPGFTAAPDDEAMGQAVNDPMALEGTERTLVAGVQRLLPGHLLEVRRDGRQAARWWRTLDHLETPPAGREAQVERFRELFIDACRLRLRSDVPVGTCLSGGLDSSSVLCTVAKLAAEQGPAERRAEEWRHAFVAEFPGAAIDERRYAEMALAKAGIAGRFVRVLEDVTVDDVDAVVRGQDDLHLNLPLPPWAIYRQLRRDGVVVSLDGHGGDELLGGYGHHPIVALRRQGGVLGGPRRAWDLLQTLHAMHEPGGPVAPPSRLDVALRADPILRGIARALKGGGGPPAPGPIPVVHDPDGDALGPLTGWLYRDFHETILPTLLRNFDRCSMAHGVEVRMPIMDWRLVCYAFALPEERKLGGGYTKRVLREAMEGILPDALRERRGKIGFNSPLGDWFAGFLRDWLLAHVNHPDFLASPFWDGPAVRDQAQAALTHGRWDWDATQRLWVRVQAHAWRQAFFAEGAA